MRPRIRTVKPEFFKHEKLFDLEAETKLPIRMAFAGLWTVTDREGRFVWRPRTLKIEALPHDPVDFGDLLDRLGAALFVVQYEVDGELYGWIPSFDKHQVINNRESESELPCPSTGKILSCDPVKFQKLWDAWVTRHTRVDEPTTTDLNPAPAEGKGTEGKGTEGVGAQGGAEASPAPVAKGSGVEHLRAVLGQDQNANLGRALGMVPTEILSDWRLRFTDDSIRKTAKKVVNKLVAKEGGFDRVKDFGARLVSCVENERESLIRRPPPRLKDPPAQPEDFQNPTPEPTPDQLAAAARKGFSAPTEVIARLAKQKAMPGKSA